MEAPLTTTTEGFKTLDGKIFAFAPWSPSERRQAEKLAREHNRTLANAADRRAGKILTARELQNGYKAPDTRPVEQQIRESGANVKTNETQKTNPYRQLSESRKHSKDWRDAMRIKADEWDRMEADQAALAAMRADPLYQRALENSEASLRLCLQDCVIPQTQIDARRQLNTDLKSGAIDPGKYWQETLKLDEEMKPVTSPSSEVTE
jgi:hypothetical protein